MLCVLALAPWISGFTDEMSSSEFHGSVSLAGPGTIRVLGPKKRTAFAEGFGHRVAIASTSYNNDLVDFKSVEGVKVFQSPGGQAELLVKVRLSVIMINMKLQIIVY